LCIEASGNNVFAGTNTNGILCSPNNGLSWVQKNEGLTNLSVSAVLINGDNLYAGTSGSGVWKRPLSELLSIKNISGEIPEVFSLYQNYPNPFNPATVIRFQLAAGSYTKLLLFDMLGREIQSLVNEQLQAGTYEVDFNASHLPSGVYYYMLSARQSGSSAGDYTETKKMVLVK
jgi:hypothetical protein